MSGTETPPGADKDHGLTATKWQVAGAVLVAVLGVVAAVLAILPRDDGGDSSAGDSSAGADPTDSSTTTTSPTTTTTTTTTLPSTSTISSGPAVFRDTRTGPVVIAYLDHFDLDSQAANWGVDEPGEDIYVDGVSTNRRITNGGTLAKFAIVKNPPTQQECEAQTLLTTHLSAAEAVVGQQMCVRTNQGRWAHVQIAGIDDDARTMSFHVTVWKLPTDP